MSEQRIERVTVTVRGYVQGVGFRWWTRYRAVELGLAGHARNLDDGRVEVLVQGPSSAVDTMVRLLSEFTSTAHRPGRVTGTVCQYSEPREDLPGFTEA